MRGPLAGIDRFPRARLGHAPTPLDPAPGLGAALGVELWIKRDDCTGLAFGGNKVRQLASRVTIASPMGPARGPSSAKPSNSSLSESSVPASIRLMLSRAARRPTGPETDAVANAPSASSSRRSLESGSPPPGSSRIASSIWSTSALRFRDWSSVRMAPRQRGSPAWPETNSIWSSSLRVASARPARCSRNTAWQNASSSGPRSTRRPDVSASTSVSSRAPSRACSLDHAGPPSESAKKSSMTRRASTRSIPASAPRT